MKLEATEQSILSRMNSIAASKAFTLEFIDAYTLLNRRISKLKYKNDAFDTRAQLQVARRRHRGATTNRPNPSCQRSKQPSTRKGSVYKVIGGEYNTPSLTLRSYRRFSFQTPKDNRSDTDHHNMIIYDPAVLQNTDIPALVHDSIMFDSMPRPDLSNPIRIYDDQVGNRFSSQSTGPASARKTRRKPSRKPPRSSSATTNILPWTKSGAERILMKIYYKEF